MLVNMTNTVTIAQLDFSRKLDRMKIVVVISNALNEGKQRRGKGNKMYLKNAAEVVNNDWKQILLNWRNRH